ncbi:hypothetical protein A3A03_03340 [Candidatus Nomurabacteria bacterium RIFCSPLOWO2_01_FULL_40_18]|uniref:D-alanyl-D-alanine carboxypeptidase-like core domain-containing protein n=1 Tax=Candidatus Nomurabacteria bacterium RIFCSPLOWO2_01_FULL_40_18 TaxID=1801773 RepID=A0A1F6XJP5_9BACT|nr:MAG: hypothetical protein A3A03_03340 [Candidatus Nomurabacteria bacterium RIFCSPLOWO2_01_FULL_40_18]
MNIKKKHILHFALALFFLSLIFVIFLPYFTTDFLDLRQQQENEENHQRFLREQRAIEQAKKDAEEKIYLMGKFDSAKREDFILIPKEYTLGSNKMYARKETYVAFLEMRKSALFQDVDLRVVSATRNFDYQKELWNNKWNGKTLVNGKDLSKSIPDGLERFEKILEFSAAPGTSRHHWGTDLDINGVSPTYFDTKEGKIQYEWLVQNAPLFGFCQVYNQRDENRPAGYSEEKWHWSYLPLSRTFTQDYERLIKETDITGFDGDEYAPYLNLIQNYVLSINPECV